MVVYPDIYALTGSGSGQHGDDEGQAQAGDMSRYHRRPPQPHVQPEVPRTRPLSHRAVLHIRPHAAEPPPARWLPAGCKRWANTERRGACAAGTLHELHYYLVKKMKIRTAPAHTDNPMNMTLVKLDTTTPSTSGV